MNIILTFDNRYSQYAAVLMASICLYNNVDNFFLISDYISDENKTKLEKVCTNGGAQATFLKVDIDTVKKFPIGGRTVNHYLSLATYYRLLIPSLLPENVSKVLYLDCDIIVNDSLSELWNFKTNEDTYVLAVEDKNVIISKAKERLQMGGHAYFNAGVMLLMIDRLRKFHFTEKAISFISEHRDLIRMHDQDVLNALLYKHVQFLPLKYNVMDHYLYQSLDLPERYLSHKKDIYNPVIIHYTGAVKPWNIECKHPYKSLYQYYLDYTPWKGTPLFHKYLTRLERLNYLLKTNIKKTLNCLGMKKYAYLKDLPLGESMQKNK